MERTHVVTRVAFGRYGESRFVAVQPPLAPKELSKMAIDGIVSPGLSQTSHGEDDHACTVLYVNGNQHGNTPDLRPAEARDSDTAIAASRISAWLTNQRDALVDLQAGMITMTPDDRVMDPFSEH